MIASAPTYNPASAYRPIIWQVVQASLDIFPIKNCKFTINIVGSDPIVGRVAPYMSTVSYLGVGFTDYYFYVDVQQYIQRYLTTRSRRSTFGGLNTDNRVINTDSFVEFTVDFQYEYIDPNGKIATYPWTDNSGYQTAGITTRQNGDDMSVDEFYGMPFITTEKRFLTNSPTSRTISEKENVFLSFWGEWSWFTVKTHDSVGTLLSQTYFPTNGGLPNQIKTSGVGKPQLDAIDPLFWFGTVTPTWTNSAYYTVQAGMGIPLGPGMLFLGNSDIHTYTFGDECSKNIRMYWTNELGGTDHFDFPYQELGLNVTSDILQKPLTWPHAQDDYGRARTNLKANKAYLVSKLLTNAEMAWIKELFYSVEVYIVNPDDSSQYWRVWLSDTEVTEKRKIGLFEVSFTVNLSQDVVTHRI